MTNIIRWLMFSVVFALIPFVFAFFHFWTTDKPATIAELVGHGELLIVSVALAADAIGDLIASGKDYVIRKLVCGGGCLVLLGLASLIFADVSMSGSTHAERVSEISSWIFILTLIATGSCKFLAEP